MCPSSGRARSTKARSWSCVCTSRAAARSVSGCFAASRLSFRMRYARPAGSPSNEPTSRTSDEPGSPCVWSRSVPARLVHRPPDRTGGCRRPDCRCRKSSHERRPLSPSSASQVAFASPLTQRRCGAFNGRFRWMVGLGGNRRGHSSCSCRSSVGRTRCTERPSEPLTRWSKSLRNSTWIAGGAVIVVQPTPDNDDKRHRI